MMEIGSDIGNVLDDRYLTLAKVLNEFAETTAPQLETSDAPQAVVALDAELENMIHVFDVFLLPDDDSLLPELEDLYLWVGGYLSQRGLFQEKIRWGTNLLRRVIHSGKIINVVLLNNLANAFGEINDQEQALSIYRFTLDAFKDDLHNPDLTPVYTNLATAYWQQGNHTKALIYIYRALEIDRHQNERRRIARDLLILSEILYDCEEPIESLDRAREALDIARETRDLSMVAGLASTVATHMMALRQFAPAEPLFKEAITVYEALREPIALARTKYNYAQLCLILKQTERGLQMMNESLAVLEQFALPEVQKAREFMAEIEAMLEAKRPK